MSGFGCRLIGGGYNSGMQTLSDVERRAMALPEVERAALAAHLLDSLPAVLADEDEGVAEALRRDDEIQRDPSAAMTLEQLRRDLRA